MPNATSKPVTVVYLPLTNYTDMINALSQAVTVGYYGNVAVDHAGATWTLTLTGMAGSGPASGTLQATVGQYVIWNGTSLAVISADGFTAGYTPQ